MNKSIICDITAFAIYAATSAYLLAIGESKLAIITAVIGLVCLLVVLTITAPSWWIPSIGFRLRLGAFAVSYLPVAATLRGERHEFGPITIFIA